MFSKDINDIELSDINNLLSETRLPENDRIEYKETLPDNGKEKDPWLQGLDKIGEHALKKLHRKLLLLQMLTEVT